MLPGTTRSGRCCPGTSGSAALVTSRHRLTALGDAAVIDLDVLPAHDAAGLLVRLSGRPGLNPADPGVAEITRLCGYLPLAVGMLARHLYHHPTWTPASLAQDLAAARDRLDLMCSENVSVAAAFDLSCRNLTAGQRRLFRRLGLHPGPDIDHYAAAALANVNLTTARRQLQALYDQHLLTEPIAGRSGRTTCSANMPEPSAPAATPWTTRPLSTGCSTSTCTPRSLRPRRFRIGLAPPYRCPPEARPPVSRQ